MNFGVSDQFITCGVNLASAVFAILILLLFVVKGKSQKISSKVFFWLIIVTLLAAGINCFTAYIVVENSPYTTLFAIITHFVINCWNYLLIFYMAICFKSNEENKEYYSKHPYISYVLGAIIIIITILACIFLKVDFTKAGEGLPYLYTGSLITFSDIIGALAIIISVVYISIYHKKLDKHAIVLGIYTIIMCVCTLSLNVFHIMTLNNTSFLHTLVLFFLYLSIESQDALLIDEFKEATKRANDYNKLRNEFIMNMSHELRTPLTSVLGFSESLIENDFTLDELKEDSKNIYLSSKSLLDLINSIIDVSKFESNKESVVMNNYSLDTIIYDISSNINSYITKNNLIFTINANEDTPNDLVGDDKKISKILNIILMTAIDHTNYGEVSLNISANMIDSVNSELIFHVKNSGHTLSIEDFNRTLDDLIKLSNDSDGGIDSKTLNLITAKFLIDLIGANIEFINETGKGTQFIIKIKQKVISRNKLGNIRDKIQTKSVLSHQILDLTNRRILIVDDSKVNISILERLLNQYSVTIDTSINPDDCLNLFNTYVYDMIFVNDKLADMSGSDFVNKLNSTGNSIPPVIGVISKNSTNISEYYDVIESPVEFRTLNTIMNKVFEKGGNTNEL